MTPGFDDLWFLPLGGTGEIGMNLNLFGHGSRWLMVDCGVTFEDSAQGNEVQMPDPEFIAQRQEALTGIIATHAHLDHIGALPYLAHHFHCPIYTTAFTARVLRPKLREAGCDTKIIEVSSGQTLSVGPFRVTWLPITHSTAETHALLIETAAGRILHTADWKIDLDPVVGPHFDSSLWRELAHSDLDAVICDSTNATQAGHSVSEGELESGLLQQVAGASGRVAIGCFASNIARLQTLGNVAAASGRYITLLGRSLITMVNAAKSCGYLADNFAPIPAKDLGYLPPHEVLILATGSQGEPGAALTRLAAKTHPILDLDSGDLVVFSAKAIPGNEEKIAAMVRLFSATGINVVHAEDSEAPLHASGHPNAEELKAMYGYLQPTMTIPVHGEQRHMQANAALAQGCGSRSMVGLNGDLFRIKPIPSILRNAVDTGRVAVDQTGSLEHRATPWRR